MLLAARAATPIPTRIPLIVRIAVHKLCSSANTTAPPDTAVNPFVLCKRPPEYAGVLLSPNDRAQAERASTPSNPRRGLRLKQNSAPKVSPSIVMRKRGAAANDARGPIDNVMTIAPARLR